MSRIARALVLALVAAGLGLSQANPAAAVGAPEGRVTCWGVNVNAQCAVPEGAGEALDGKTVVDLATGFGHDLALTSEGDVVAWGGNDAGERDVPASLDGETVRRVFAGQTQSMALTDDGQVIEWGSLVEESSFGVPLSDRLPDYPAKIIDISVGPNHALALLDNGIVVPWGSPGGSANYGQPPHDVFDRPLFGKRAIDVSASFNLSMAVTTDGKVVVWGLDNATTAPVLDVPDGPGEALDGKTVVTAEFGRYHALALTSEGKVVAWGGDGNAPDDYGQTDVPDGPGEALDGKTVVAIDGGSHHSLALTSEGEVVTWGAGGPAQAVGDVPHWGQSNPPDGPGEALDGVKVLQAAAGHLHSMALYAATNAPASGTTVGVTGVPSTVTLNTPVTATITVSPVSGSQAPNGQVEVFDGDVKIGQVPVTNHAAQFVVPTDVVGSHELTFRYAGAPGLNPGVSEPVSYTVTDDKIFTVTTLTAPASIGEGTAEDVTIVVSGMAPGSVALEGLPSGPITGTLTDGFAILTIPNATPAGSYQIRGTYAGTATHDPSESAEQTLVVEPATAPVTTTQVQIAGAPEQGDYGQEAAGLTVTVVDAAGLVTISGGTLNLYEEDTLLRSVPYAGPNTPVTLPVLKGGIRRLQVRFTSGQDFVLDSQSGIFEYRVLRVEPELALEVSGSLVAGQSRTVTATAARATPNAEHVSGVLSLIGIPAVDTTQELVDGGAVFTVPASTPPGTYQVSVSYMGDDNYSAASSEDVETTIVDPVTVTEVQLVGVPTGVTYGATGTGMTVTVSDAPGEEVIEGGGLELYDGATMIASRPYLGAATPLTIPVLGGGAHQLQVRYVSGQELVLDGASADFDYPVTRAPAEVLLAVVGSLVAGESRTITASVARASALADHATGVVTLTGIASDDDTQALVDGVATFTVPASTPVGTYQVSASYPGDVNYVAGTAEDLETTIATAVTTLAVTGIGPSSRYGVAKQASVTVSSSAGVPVGSVEIRSGKLLLGTATLVDGTAKLTVRANLPVRSHALAFSYVPPASSDFVAGSTTVAHQVLRARTVLKAKLRKKPTRTKKGKLRVVVRQLDGVLVPHGGSVILRANGKKVGAAVLRRGKANVAVKKLRPRKHVIKVIYRGSPQFGSARSKIKLKVR